jgi:hypothetical protein
MGIKPELISAREVRNNVGRLAWTGDKKEVTIVDGDKAGVRNQFCRDVAERKPKGLKT